MSHQTRIGVIGLLLLVPFGALEARLVWLQGIHGREIREEADQKVTRIEVIPPCRGSIRDRNGTLLAYDERIFDVAIVLRDLSRADRALDDLSLALGRPRAELAEIRDDPAQTPEALTVGLAGRAGKAARKLARLWRSQPTREEVLVSLGAALGVESGILAEKVQQLEARLLETASRRDAGVQVDRLAGLRAEPRTLVTGFPFERVRAIDLHPERFPGILVQEGVRRVYPLGRLAGALVGYVGRFGTLADGRDEYQMLEQAGFFRRAFEGVIGDEEYADLEEAESFTREVVGRMGIERAYDDDLRGRHGVMVTETDRRTGATRVLRKVAARPGSDVTLTIDLRLQKATEAALEERFVRMGLCGAAVVLDPHDGSVLAMASVPGYDPGDFLPGADPARIAYYFGPDGHNPLLQRAVMGRYPAGSVFKIVTAIAAIEGGQLTPDTSYECEGQYHDSPPYFKCSAFPGKHGRMTLEEALERSCNVFFFHVGESIGVDPIAEWGWRLGFGRPTGIDLPMEASGDLPTPEWRAVRHGGKWHPNDTLNLSIGQGTLTVTPLQVASLLAFVANGGKVVHPHLGAALAPGTTPVSLSSGTLDRIRRGLHDVVNAPGGTASKTGLWRYGAAGKTSTAEVAGADDGGKLPHAWFAGYAPDQDPKVAFAVIVENGGHGNEVAAPIAEEILEAVFPGDRSTEKK